MPDHPNLARQGVCLVGEPLAGGASPAFQEPAAVCPTFPPAPGPVAEAAYAGTRVDTHGQRMLCPGTPIAS